METYDYNQFYKTKSQTGYDIFRQGGQKLSYEEALPMFQSGFNAEFIKEQQPAPQAPIQPLPINREDGGQTQLPVQPAQPIQPTPVAPQPTQQPIQQPTQQPASQPLNTNPTSYYKVNTGNTGVDGRPAYDIYDALTNQKISAEQGTPLFAGGLNVDFIPEKPVPGQQPSQPPQTQQPTQTAQTSTPAQQLATGQTGATGGVPTTPTIPTQMPYVQYAGSPDVFERTTGTYIPAEQAAKLGINNALQVEQMTAPRPDIKTEADFANLAKTNLQLQEKGITVTPEDFQNNPLKAFQDTYSQIWTNLGLNSVKEQIETTLKAMKEVDFEMIDKIAEVNDNPWITEGARSREVTKLQNKYEQKNAANTENLKLLQGLYDIGRQEAQFTAENAMEAYYNQQTFDQQILLKQMDLAEKMATAMNKKTFQDLVGSDGRMHTYIVNEAGEKLVDLGVSELPKAGGGTTGGGGGGGISTIINPETEQMFSNNALAYAKDYLKTGNLPSAADMRYSEVTPSEILAASKTLPKEPTATEIAKKEAMTSSLPVIQEKIDLINSIANNPALNSVVGGSFLGRIPFNPIESYFRGDKKAILGSISQLVDKETLATLLQLKAGGGTLGAISEKELSILQSAATKISAWGKEAVLGKDIIGYGVSEKVFRKELQKIKGSAERLKKSIEKSLQEADLPETPKLLTPAEIPQGYYQASDGLLYTK